jgi:hypothetical protein
MYMLYKLYNIWEIRPQDPAGIFSRKFLRGLGALPSLELSFGKGDTDDKTELLEILKSPQ